MLQRLFPITVFAFLLGALQWGAQEVVSPSTADSVEKSSLIQSRPRHAAHDRVELLEALDRVVEYERYYRSVYGHFTQLLSRIGFPIPRSLAGVYEIRVADASPDRLLITAFSEENGKMGDVVSIDQDFQVHSNFQLPAPGLDYLRVRAMKHLRAMRDAPKGQVPEEESMFRGYFRYEVHSDPASDHRTAFAVGIRPPAVGLQLELGEGSEVGLGKEALPGRYLTELADEMNPDESTHTGQSSTGNVNTFEEAYLAQKIFHGEVGRYAKSWGELSQVAGFQFDQDAKSRGLPFSEGSEALEIDADSQLGVKKEPTRNVSSTESSSDLEIEALDSEESTSSLQGSGQTWAQRERGNRHGD